MDMAVGNLQMYVSLLHEKNISRRQIIVNISILFLKFKW